jgi:DNA replication licensing factor MCM6
MSAPIMSRFDLFFIVLDEQDDTCDFNVARHILNLHQNMDEAINVQFTAEQLQRYIRFARTLKPQLTLESRDLLVQQYRALRNSDAGGRKTSYRITVRQLESMIRLSEALARLHCDDEVKPKYVREAFRLLKKSIIHVESEDIILEDENVLLDSSETNNEKTTATPLENFDSAETSPVKKKPITIPYNVYYRIATSIVLHLRRHAESHVDGVRKSDLIGWYLQSKEDEINSEEELMEQRKFIKTILNRLIHKVKKTSLFSMIITISLSSINAFLLVLLGQYPFGITSPRF